jgi:Ribonuclease G/E
MAKCPNCGQEPGAAEERDALRDVMEVIASPAGTEPPLWATYVARRALGEKLTATMEEFCERGAGERTTLRAENASLRASLAGLREMRRATEAFRDNVAREDGRLAVSRDYVVREVTAIMHLFDAAAGKALGTEGEQRG